MLNVLVADNQTLTCEGVIALLSNFKDIKVVGKAANDVELEQLTTNFRPEVIIIDHRFGDGFSTDTIANIYKKFNFARVIILSDCHDRDEILKLVDLGVKNYVCKRCSAKEVIDAVYATARGEQFFCKNTMQVLLGEKNQLAQSDEMRSLSVREKEIVHLVAEGMTNKEIAEKLFLSIHTVKTHRKNIIKKMGFTFKNAAELILLTGAK